MSDPISLARDFYEKHLLDPYSKQRDTAAFHLLGLQLDHLEADSVASSSNVRYDSGTSTALSENPTAKDPFSDV